MTKSDIIDNRQILLDTDTIEEIISSPGYTFTSDYKAHRSKQDDLVIVLWSSTIVN